MSHPLLIGLFDKPDVAAGAARALRELGVPPAKVPIVADGPLAAGLGEAAGHLAGGLARALERAGMPRHDAAAWEARVKGGAVMIGAHVRETAVEQVAESLRTSGAQAVTRC